MKRSIVCALLSVILFFQLGANQLLAQEIMAVQLPENSLIHSLEKRTSTLEIEKNWEFSISSWSPRHLSLDSFISEASSFSRGTFPTLSVNRTFSPIRLDSSATLEMIPTVGFSFLEMSRIGRLRYSSFEETIEQSLILIPLRMGMKFSIFGPSIGLSLLPTIALSTKSALSDGKLTVGLPIEVSIQKSFKFPALSSLLTFLKPALQLGVITTFGALRTERASGDFFGLGFLLGFDIKT